MQTKTGPFHSMGRVPQLLGHAVLAAGMLAGASSMLNAGGAMAASCDVAPYNNGMNYSFISGTSAYGSCKDVLKNIASVDYDFPAPTELPGPASGEFRYQITAAAGEHFIQALIDSDVDVPGGVTVRKEIFPTLTDLTNGTNKIWDYTSTDGSNSLFQTVPNQYTTLYVKDTYNVPDGAVLDNFTNTYKQTPGPLPILGAGAAFGFSRKLRGRIKAARLS